MSGKQRPRRRRKSVSEKQVAIVGPGPIHLCYLFTTFPLLSETFLQREFRVMRDRVATLSAYTIWGGGDHFEGTAVRRFRWYELFALLYWLPYWTYRRPRAVGGVVKGWFMKSPSYLKNWGETLLGQAFALIYARKIAAQRVDLIHAVWATMPATAAMLIEELVGIPFTMGGHAYDIFKKGGDCLLREKVRRARRIHTSTRFARKHLIGLGAPSTRVVWIRRGLSSFPPVNQLRESIEVPRLLSIGRLVDKKGYVEQMRIYSALRKRGIAFEARIIGDGPLRRELGEMIRQLELEGIVTLVGSVPHDEVQAHYAWSDLFVFTGVVDPSGDRNGLANVIPEALARGLPVLATPDSGIRENFVHDRELVIQDLSPADAWVKTILDLQVDASRRFRLGAAGRVWTEKYFDATKNTGKWHQCLCEVLREIREAMTSLPPDG